MSNSKKCMTGNRKMGSSISNFRNTWNRFTNQTFQNHPNLLQYFKMHEQEELEENDARKTGKVGTSEQELIARNLDPAQIGKEAPRTFFSFFFFFSCDLTGVAAHRYCRIQKQKAMVHCADVDCNERKRPRCPDWIWILTEKHGGSDSEKLWRSRSESGMCGCWEKTRVLQTKLGTAAERRGEAKKEMQERCNNSQIWRTEDLQSEGRGQTGQIWVTTDWSSRSQIGDDPRQREGAELGGRVLLAVVVQTTRT